VSTALSSDGATSRGVFVSIGSTAVSAIGVSYGTFQSISYLVDVTLQSQQHERHFGYLALYLSYFPKLLQGPIERSEVFIRQLRSPGVFDYGRVRSGLILICWGLFKKAAVADRLSVVVDEVFGSLHSYSGLSLLAGAYAYALQIYADFSGYTDMAIGFSKVLGISLTDNSDRPYFSASLAEFWRRWHMSFMNWLSD
jgi:alginate O-acetyltransferase complex protein AlgI